MRQLRLILALLFVFAFSSSAFAADVLIERYANSEVYKVNSTTKKLVIGGDIENALPFDGGEYTPWNLIFAEGTPMGNWTWLGKGNIGYLIKPSISTVRMYPVRGDPTKFIEIAPLAAQPSIVNQISPKNLELYVDQPNTRWSLSMTPQGFKPNILLKPGYSGDGTFQFRFELNGGLTLNGAWIMDGANRTLKMHNPFMVDAGGINRDVDESLIDGIITLTANLSGLTYPIVIDPTLGPINPNQDTTLWLNNPTTGYGQLGFIYLFNGSATQAWALWLWDVSAIPSGSTIISSDMVISQAAPYFTGRGQIMDLVRLTITDWEDASGVDAEANYNNYKAAGPTAWPGGAGALGDIDGSVIDSYTVAVAANDTVSIINNTQDAVNSRSGIISMVHKFRNQTTDPPDYKQSYHSLEGAGAKPTLTVEYTEQTDNHLLRPWCSKKGVNNEKAICTLPYHIN